jgi:NADH-quinone oxidoreductase subunit J
MVDSLFYIFAALTVAAALCVVASRNPVNSAMGMVLALLGVAANFFLLDAPFLGTVQILVYAGAVIVLFLFVIMLLDVEREVSRPVPWASLAVGAVVLAGTFGAFWWLLNQPGSLPLSPEPLAPAPLLADAAHPAAYATGTKAYGYSLFSKYMLPLQMAGFLLLIAMLGVVVLSRKNKAKPERSN